MVHWLRSLCPHSVHPSCLGLKCIYHRLSDWTPLSCRWLRVNSPLLTLTRCPWSHGQRRTVIAMKINDLLDSEGNRSELPLWRQLDMLTIKWGKLTVKHFPICKRLAQEEPYPSHREGLFTSLDCDLSWTYRKGHWGQGDHHWDVLKRIVWLYGVSQVLWTWNGLLLDLHCNPFVHQLMIVLATLVALTGWYYPWSIYMHLVLRRFYHKSGCHNSNEKMKPWSGPLNMALCQNSLFSDQTNFHLSFPCMRILLFRHWHLYNTKDSLVSFCENTLHANLNANSFGVLIKGPQTFTYTCHGTMLRCIGSKLRHGVYVGYKTPSDDAHSWCHFLHVRRIW